MGRPDPQKKSSSKKGQSSSSRPSHRTTDSQSGEWSTWDWIPKYSTYGRYRTNSAGQIVYEYLPVGDAPPNQPDQPQQGVTQHTNPSQGSIRDYSQASMQDDLAARLQNTNLTESMIRPQDRNTDTERAPFDKNFRVHHAKQFKVGKVFKVLWPEPMGDGGANRPCGSSHASMTAIRVGDRKFHEKVRRFVVIVQRQGHCVCLAINTYGKQGTTKPGVQAGDHTMVYTGKEPSLLQGEVLYKVPIKMEPNTPRDHLSHQSRLNYAKIYTVECNVKVSFVGTIKSPHIENLIIDYNMTNPQVEPPSSSTSRRQLTAPSTSHSTMHATGGGSIPSETPTLNSPTYNRGRLAYTAQSLPTDYEYQVPNPHNYTYAPTLSDNPRDSGGAETPRAAPLQYNTGNENSSSLPRNEFSNQPDSEYHSQDSTDSQDFAAASNESHHIQYDPHSYDLNQPYQSYPPADDDIYDA